MAKNLTYKEELEQIAKKYCADKGFDFIFVNESDATFGYDIGDGNFVHRSFQDLAIELGAKPNDFKKGGRFASVER